MQPAGHDRAGFGGDELLTPSLQHLPGGLAAARRPWRVGSQFWVAFFGGPLAVGAIAWLNAGRLGLPASRRRAVLAVSSLAFVALLGGLGWSLAALEQEAGRRLLLRRAVQASGVLVYLALAWLQRTADRRHQAFGGEYASLWVPGLLAVLGGAAMQFAAAFSVALAVAGLRS
jgi:hypothetical protein